MAKFDLYLNFPGTTEEAFNFYKDVFGGEFKAIQRFKDTPEGSKLSPEEQEKLMHISLPLNEHTVLMGTDALETMGHPLTKGNHFAISIAAASKEEADELFGKLSVGGNVTLPLGVTFWNAYFGMVTDQFGTQWMVGFDLNT